MSILHTQVVPSLPALQGHLKMASLVTPSSFVNPFIRRFYARSLYSLLAGRVRSKPGCRHPDGNPTSVGVKSISVISMARYCPGDFRLDRSGSNSLCHRRNLTKFINGL